MALEFPVVKACWPTGDEKKEKLVIFEIALYRDGTIQFRLNVKKLKKDYTHDIFEVDILWLERKYATGSIDPLKRSSTGKGVEIVYFRDRICFLGREKMFAYKRDAIRDKYVIIKNLQKQCKKHPVPKSARHESKVAS